MEATAPTATEQRFSDIERRLDKLESDEWRAEFQKAITEVKVSIANLNGRLAGYLAAAGVLGAVVSFLAQYALKR